MKILVVAILLGSLGCSAKAEERVDPKYSKEAEKTAAAKSEAIEAEIKRLGDHPWGGKYYHGDGLGLNISMTIAPKSGYVYEWHGCLGCYDRNYGDATWTRDRIDLTVAFVNSQDWPRPMSKQLVPVRWGQRRYLIATEQMIDFCNAVNSGIEWATWCYLLRRGDQIEEVTSLPEVPEEFKSYLLSEPIEVKLIAVGERGRPYSSREKNTVDYPVIFDGGADKGLKVGMELFNVYQRSSDGIKITKVEADRCEGIVAIPEAKIYTPAIGSEYSTRSAWYSESVE